MLFVQAARPYCLLIRPNLLFGEHWLDLAVFSRNQVLLFGKDVDFETHVVLRHTGSAVAPALPVDYLVILDNVLLSS